MVEQRGSEHALNRGEVALKCQPKGHRLLLYLTLILLAECWLTLRFLRQDPQFIRWFAYWQSKWTMKQSQIQFQEAIKNDPPLGLELGKVGLSDFVGNEPDKAILLIVFGGCEGCSARVVQGWAGTLGSWETWKKAKVEGVLVFQENEEAVRKAAREGKWKVKTIADEKGQISKQLNAFFLPRAYGFIGGRLVWIQKEPNQGIVETLESFLKVAKGEKKAVELLNAWSAEMRERAWGKEVSKLVGRREKK